jgi:hypothetical protein
MQQKGLESKSGAHSCVHWSRFRGMLQDMSTAPDTAEGIRARTRREVVAAIKAAAPRQLPT